MLAAAGGSAAELLGAYAEVSTAITDNNPTAQPQNEVIVNQASPIVLTTPGQTYQLQTSLRFSGNGIYIAAPNVTLDLNGHTIYYGSGNTNAVNDHLQGAHGVVVYLNWHNTEISIPGATNPTNAVIKNGRVVHEGTGAVSHAIYGRQGFGAIIQDLHAEANGKDSHSVYFYSGNFFLYRNVLISHASESFNRHSGPANVHGVTVAAYNNILIGGNSGFAVLDDSVLIGNVIAHDGHVTNGYGVWLYRTSNVVVRDNIILPSNGRGVLLNAGSNIQVEDNLILHLEAPNAEFGDALNAPAIRSRYDTSGNIVTGNIGLGIAGADIGLTSASGLYLTDDGTGVPSRYENNELTTILVGPRDSSHYAQPITFEGQGYVQRSNNTISGNVFRGNDSLVRAQGWDGTMENAAPIVGNELQWIDGNGAAANFVAAITAKLSEIQMSSNLVALQVVNDAVNRIQSLISGVPLNPDRATWFLKYSTHTARVDGTFLDNQAGNGVALDSFAYSFLSAGEVSVKVGQTVPVLLQGVSGALGNIVTGVSSDLADSYQETTSGSGVVDLPVIEFAFEKAYAANSPIVKRDRTTTTISVTGYQPLTLSNAFLLSHKNDSTPLVIALTPLGSVAPQASGDSYSTNEDQTLNVPAAGVLLNDTDPQPLPLTSVLVTGPSHGVLQLNANGSFSYSPAANYHGPDSFTYRASNGSELSNLATVTIAIQPVNDAPAGTSRAITTIEDAAYTLAAADFGFSDPNDSPANSLLAVRITTLPAAGTLTNNSLAVNAGQFVSAADIAAGRLRFTPAANASGNNYASFTFQVQDDGGTANGGVDLDPTPNTITFNVTPVNDAPAGTNRTVTIAEDITYSFAAADFGFADPNDSPANSLLAVRITNLPAAGQLLLNGSAVTAGQSISAANLASGLLRFIPAANASGSPYASFAFQVQDNGDTANGGTDLDPTPNTITFNVTSVNDPPAGINRSVSMAEDTTYTFTAADFAFSDSLDSPPNGLAAVRIATLPIAGQLSLNGSAVNAGQFVTAAQLAAGLLRFTPAAHAHGASYASFTFQVQDNGGTASGGVDLDPTPNAITISVTSVNDFPLGIDRVVTTRQSVPYTFLLSDFGFHDPADAPSNNFQAVRVATLPSAGSLVNNGSPIAAGQYVSATDILAGRMQFIPGTGASGSSYASFTFQVQDDGGTANGGADLDLVPNTITIDVTAGVAGLVGLWRFDEGSGMIAQDTSGNGNHGTMMLGANYAAGQSGTSLIMTQPTKWVQVGDAASLDLTGPMTLAAWISPISVRTQTVLSKAVNQQADGFELSLSNSGKVFARFNQRSSGDAYRIDSISSYPTNGSWMHVVATYDGSQIRLYINGALQATKSASFTVNVNNLSLGIGADAIGGRGMPGRIDDALVANRAFTPGEVSALYGGTLLSGGVTNHAPVVDAGVDSVANVGVAITLNGGVSDDGAPLPASLTSQWSIVSGPGNVTFGNSSSPVTTATFSTAGTYVLRLTANDGSLTASDELTVQVSPAGTASLLGFWNFLPGVGGQYPSAIGHLGETQGGASVSTDGRLTLASAGQSYLVPDMPALQITQTITMAAWIKPAASGAQSIVKKAAGSSVDGFELALSETGKVYVRFNEQSSANALRVDSTANYPSTGTNWMHVAATYDGATIRLYLNGQLAGSKAANFAIGTNDLSLVFGSGLIGQMDEVLLDTHALSAAEIDELYRGRLQPAAPANRAPTVQAGADLSVQAGTPIGLVGSASDDGHPNGQLSYQWLVISGPGSVNFSNPNSAQTTATFATSGTYHLRLWAADGALVASDDLIVSVAPASPHSGVVGFWRFEDSGSSVSDSSGNLNHGSLQGGAHIGIGHTGGGLLMSQALHSLVVPHAASLMPTAQLTIAAWIAPISKANQTVVSKASMNTVDGYELSLSKGGKVFVRFNQQSSGDSFRLNSATSYSRKGSWMHVAATYDGSTIRLYVNGVLEASKAASFAINANTLAVGIGAEASGKRGMRGRLDDVLIADRALNQTEIASLYGGALPMSLPADSLVALAEPLIGSPAEAWDPTGGMDAGPAPTAIEAQRLDVAVRQLNWGDDSSRQLMVDRAIHVIYDKELLSPEHLADVELIDELATAILLRE